MQLPPPRYRVVERGRRLETIDARTGEHITAPLRLPVGDRRPSVAGGPADRQSARGDRAIARDAGNMTAGMLVALLCRGERLPDGRYVLRTSAAFDERGPRAIAIGPAAMRPIAMFGGAVALAGIALLAAFLWFGFPAIVFAGIALGMIGQHGKGAIARLLDPLGEPIEQPDRD